MTNHRRTRLLLGGLTATLGLSLTAAPAYAERVQVQDPEDGVSAATPFDIDSVRVRFGQKRAVVDVLFDDLVTETDGGPASVEIFIDTKPRRTGPEWRLATGLQEGSDYQVVRMKDWEPVGEPLSCAHRVELDTEADAVHARLGKDCIGYPKKMRVAVKMTDLYDGSHPVTDWLVKARYWTVFLASG